MKACPECGNEFARLAAGGQDALVVLRLVRDRQGVLYPWHTTAKTVSPHVSVCICCLARLPLHDPLEPDETADWELPYGARGAVWSRPPDPETKEGQAVLERDLKKFPAGEAICGWPSGASCYLVAETLLKNRLPKVWEILQRSATTERQVAETFRQPWWRRWFFRRRPGSA